MRALAISDLHFGAWTGDPVLTRPFARARLAPLLEEADELVLLGDVFDLLFSSVENAFAQADPFFELVRERMRGGRVVFLAGNHDHHIVVRTLRSLVETHVATGAEGEELQRLFAAEHRGFFQRYMDRRLDGVECEVVYPYHTVGDVLLCHGHYLDGHVSGSLPNRILTRGVWAVAGGRPDDELTVEDYEAVIVPLTELLFTVAQLPRGTAAQMAFLHQFERLGRVLAAGSLLERELRRVRRRLAGRRTDGADGGGRLMRRWERPPARACSPSDPATVALAAYARVVRNLGWDRLAKKMVFSHTHQPLSAARDPLGGEVRYWNTGSWIYEPSLGSVESYTGYLERAWPGTVVRIDTSAEAPELIELLADQNPLRGGPSELRSVSDRFSEPARAYDAELGTRLAA